VRRLSPAFLTVAMLGVVGLLVVMYVGKKLLAREAPAPVDNRISVPMALTDLEPGTRVLEAHLATGPADRTKIDRHVALSPRVLVGRVVKNKITATQPISTLDLYPPGEDAPLDIDPGMVAVVVGAPSPFVARRGEYVNVHFTPSSDPDSDLTGGRIMTLFQGVKVLQLVSTGRGGGEAGVKLELTKEQANILLLAQDKGTLNFTLAPEGKGTGVVAVSDADRATLYEILGYKPTPESPAIPPFSTDLFHGTSHGVNSFRNGRFVDDVQRDENNSIRSGNGSRGGTGTQSPSGGRQTEGRSPGAGTRSGPSA